MNNIILSGNIECEPSLSHELYGEKFYKFDLSCRRLSGTRDIIHCVIPEVLIEGINREKYIKICGEIRTRNIYDGDRFRLDVFVFVNDVLEYEGVDENFVEIKGFLCKEPIFRNTPLGRQITDVIIASNRERNNKSDYIPAIIWGRNAIMASYINVGSELNIVGRLQSREYKKKLSETEFENRTAYEVSCIKITVLDRKQNNMEVNTDVNGD